MLHAKLWGFLLSCPMPNKTKLSPGPTLTLPQHCNFFLVFFFFFFNLEKVGEGKGPGHGSVWPLASHRLVWLLWGDWKALELHRMIPPSGIAPSGRDTAPAFPSCPPVLLPLSLASAVSWEMVSTDTRELVLVWKYLVQPGTVFMGERITQMV